MGIFFREHEVAAGRRRHREDAHLGFGWIQDVDDGFQRAGYQGFLLYAYGIKNELVPSDSAIPPGRVLLKRDPAARMIRSGGEPSPYGGFQVSAGGTMPIRRSGGLEIEVRGNYNTLGWLVTLTDGDWWKAANLGDAAADLYSIAHHEIGHALIFNPNNSLIKRGQTLNDERIRAYLGSSPALNQSDHLDGVIDPASLHGAFGNEYHGRMPRGRWLITKLDLLCAAPLVTSFARLRPSRRIPIVDLGFLHQFAPGAGIAVAQGSPNSRPAYSCWRRSVGFSHRGRAKPGSGVSMNTLSPVATASNRVERPRLIARRRLCGCQGGGVERCDRMLEAVPLSIEEQKHDRPHRQESGLGRPSDGRV